MSDPIDKLTSFGSSFEGGTMPVPAAEVRRRGDTIRRRRHALVAAGSALAVAAVAVPVFAITGGNGGPDRVDPAPDPTPTITDPAGAGLSEANLMTDDDTVYDEVSDWVATSTAPGDGQAVVGPCERASFERLGATAVFQREFALQVIGGTSSDNVQGLNQRIAQFPSAAVARDAFDEFLGWINRCTPEGSTGYATDFSPIGIQVDGAQVAVSTYTLDIEEGGESYADRRVDTGITVSGDRLTVLTHFLPDSDYGWTDGTPVERMLPAATERLVAGGEASEDPGTGWPTSLPDDFPLVSGMPEDDGSSEYRLEPPSEDNPAMVPAGELMACGQTVDGGDSVDRLTTRLTHGSDGQVREIQLFADDIEAEMFLDAVQDLYSACETEGEAPTITTTVDSGAVGEQSWVIQRASDGIGRGVIHVIRVGNAVLVESIGDEGPGDETGDLTVQARENLSDVIGAMYDLQGGGETGNEVDPAPPTPATPTPATTIPDGFPLDAAAAEPGGDATVEGPGPRVAGARPETACGEALAFPNASRPDPGRDLGYSVSDLEGYDGRTIRVYPTAQDAVAQMDLLRSQLIGCERDNAGDGLSERLWESYSSDTGYDSVTFGWSYEEVSGVGASAGSLYTVVRVGNAILAVEWSSEGGAEYRAAAAPDQVDLVGLITPEMCVFTADGC